MGLDPNAVGRDPTTVEVSWKTHDSRLYALAVGAGHADPCAELEFTTENTEGVVPRVLPTFGTWIAYTRSRWPDIGPIDYARGLHASQSLRLHGLLALEGCARVMTHVSSICDGGWGAQITYETRAFDSATGQPLLTAEMTTFVRGEGRFGGPEIPPSAWQRPRRAPDITVTVATRPEQALLYRLCGDRNRLHSDPGFAAKCGFGRPILHGLCTYGIVGRALLHAACGSDPARFGSIEARFRRPVVPGDSLGISAWLEDTRCLFQATNPRGQVVVDAGILAYPS